MIVNKTDVPYLVRTSQGVFENTNEAERISYTKRKMVALARQTEVNSLKTEINNIREDLSDIKRVLKLLAAQ